jgi:small-conductance mechanosensitive channel
MLLLPNLLWASEQCSSDYLTTVSKKVEACLQRMDNQPYSKIVLYQVSTELHSYSIQIDNCIVQLKKTIEALNTSYSIIKTEQGNIEISYFKTQTQKHEAELKYNTQLLVLSQYLKSQIEQVQLHSQKQLYLNTNLFMHEQITPFFRVIRELIAQKTYKSIQIQKNIHDTYFSTYIPYRLRFTMLLLILIFAFHSLSHIKKYQKLKFNYPNIAITLVLFTFSQPITFQIIKIDFSHSFDIYLREYQTLIVRFLGFLNFCYLLKYFKIKSRWVGMFRIVIMSATLLLSYILILQANYLELNKPDLYHVIYLLQYLSYIMVMCTIYCNLTWLVLKSVPIDLVKYVPWFTRIIYTTFIILFIIALNGYLYFAFSISLSIFIITKFIWWALTALHITNEAIADLYSEQSSIGKWMQQFIYLKKYHSKDITIIKTILFSGILGRVSMIIWNNWYLSPGIYLRITEHITIKLNLLEFSVSPLYVTESLIFFAFSKIMARIMANMISKKISTVKEIEYRVQRTLYAIGVTISFFLALKIAGIELENLAIVAGALSFGIGVGLQDIMKNVISGILMMIYNPISKNDYIHIKEFRGYIKKFTLLTTQIETLDNTDVMIPNRYILDSILENFTYKNNKYHKIHLKFYLNNLEDFHRAKKAILKFLSTQKDVILLDTSYAPSILIHPENAKGVELEVICTLKQFENEDRTISDMYLNIIPILNKAKIDFQLNNMDHN